MIALDLFAGVGWAVACRELGITDRGVENAPIVVETRDLAGFETLYRDVWDGLLGVHGVGRYDILIASPPCQTFSAAGKGAGRQALEQVLDAITDGLYRDAVALHELTEALDPRTALVLAPLAHVYRDRPTYVVLEQVPPVLPVWEAYAAVMRDLGYSVVTGVLNAEQYGVPQTRRRAILIARRDGKAAAMPAPTHSRYYNRDPKRLDLGVKSWVSMAEALGWGMAERPSPTVTGGGTETGGAEPIAKLDRYTSRPDWVQQRHRGAGMLERHGERAGRPVDEPALTITGNAFGTTPGGFAVLRSNYGTSGDSENRGERALDQSAPTVTSKAGRNHWVTEPGALPDATGALRLTEAQAAVLQTFPADFAWAGNKGQRFLTIGNAVPPLLARAVLEAATA
jgi:DNA (cytosine-5)-methyltransferase 1